MLHKLRSSFSSLKENVATLIRIIKSNSNYMSKGDKVPREEIDLENGIVYGVLKQIKSTENSNSDPRVPKLTKVWCYDVKPMKSKLLITFIREFMTPVDPLSYVHLKRFKKETRQVGENSNEHEIVLKTILCSSDLFNTKDELSNYLQSHFDDFDENGKLYQKEIPMNPASTKEISRQWSDSYWPMSWKGNPNHQVLLESKFNLTKERGMIDKLLDELQAYREKNPQKIAVATIIAQNTNSLEEHKILSITFDDRMTYPLDHSVMKGIEEIAKNEKHDRAQLEHNKNQNGNYLCHDLLVYTTHEPCVMCSMALVHSRIGRIIYLKDMPLTGGLGSNFQLGDRDGLNWNFEIWKWIGESESQRLDGIINPGAGIFGTTNI